MSPPSLKARRLHNSRRELVAACEATSTTGLILFRAFVQALGGLDPRRNGRKTSRKHGLKSYRHTQRLTQTTFLFGTNTQQTDRHKQHSCLAPGGRFFFPRHLTTHYILEAFSAASAAESSSLLGCYSYSEPRNRGRAAPRNCIKLCGCNTRALRASHVRMQHTCALRASSLDDKIMRSRSTPIPRLRI